jgi:AcrR family transcriptional regulator
MRIKTDERRKGILDAAGAIFREFGFGRASMAAISAKVGGSKATLYSYFKSKDELFAAVMFEAMEEQGQQVLDLLDPSDPDLRGVLERFGAAYLGMLLGAEALANTRIAIAEAENSKLGARLYDLGPRPFWETVAAYLDMQMSRSALVTAPPPLAALHLQGLLEAGVMEPALFGVEPLLERARGVEAAVDLFLRRYGEPSAMQQAGR